MHIIKDDSEDALDPVHAYKLPLSFNDHIHAQQYVDVHT